MSVQIPSKIEEEFRQNLKDKVEVMTANENANKISSS